MSSDVVERLHALRRFLPAHTSGVAFVAHLRDDRTLLPHRLPEASEKSLVIAQFGDADAAPDTLRVLPLIVLSVALEILQLRFCITSVPLEGRNLLCKAALSLLGEALDGLEAVGAGHGWRSE